MSEHLFKEVNCYSSCPRCAHRSYEKLKSYSHCINCFFTSDEFQVVLTKGDSYLKQINDLERLLKKVSEIKPKTNKPKQIEEVAA